MGEKPENHIAIVNNCGAEVDYTAGFTITKSLVCKNPMAYVSHKCCSFITQSHCYVD